MFQPSTSPAWPVSGSVFDCASSFASVALVQLAGGKPMGERLQRCIARLISHRKAR
ncbi:hypothetical protein ACFW0H_00785 [Pseudomonas sp. CR3202]|uniref:hypothetical protein n=1 Tax=Pseudomonas sp. CR3202 TaxID=3351532 RepID=UPI003BF1A60C